MTIPQYLLNLQVKLHIMNLKSLLKDTAIYGMSSIVGRFLNYLLVPIYTYKIAAESGGYGIVSNLYAYTALFLAVLTFGMETTLFRFSNKEGKDINKVYGTSLWMVGTVSLCFIILIMLLRNPLAAAMGYAAHPGYISCMGTIVAFDALQAIMFSRLRQQCKPLKFMCLKFAFIVPNILLNLFIFLVLPLTFPSHPRLHLIYDRLDYGVGLIFYINLICTALVFFGFVSELKGLKYGFDKKLCREMLKYTWPILIFSLVGILNQVADKILFPYLMPGKEGMVQLGIYGACVKIAMVMTLLVQAFRYAYEPIVFNGSRSKDNVETLAEGTKYFIIFALLAFLAVVVYLPVLRHFIDPAYWDGLGIIPIVMVAEIFMGIYFNLSFWYKLTDQTIWGAIMSAIGAAIMICFNILLVPKMGYWACAWGGFAGYGTSMLLSYFIGQKKYPVNYDIKSIGLFTILATVIYLICHRMTISGMKPLPFMLIGTVLLIVFCAAIYFWVKKTSKKPNLA